MGQAARVIVLGRRFRWQTQALKAFGLFLQLKPLTLAVPAYSPDWSAGLDLG